jgi:hypothetical protein
VPAAVDEFRKAARDAVGWPDDWPMAPARLPASLHAIQDGKIAGAPEQSAHAAFPGVSVHPEAWLYHSTTAFGGGALVWLKQWTRYLDEPDVPLHRLHVLVYSNRRGACTVIESRREDDCRTFAELVDSLGVDGGGDREIIAALQTTPRQAVRALVARLHLPGNFDESQMSWRLRALEAITGMDFTARTREPLDEIQQRCVAPDSDMGFWVHHMSAQITTRAPADVQREIIRQWRAWVAVHGESFEPRHGVPTYTYPLG